MKNLLGYQVSEYDCGTTCLKNGLSYLFERNEIPVELLKIINLYSLDLADQKGIFGKMGTSDIALKHICESFNDYSKKTKFNLSCKIIEKSDVNFNNCELINCLKNNGAFIVKCMIGIPHFVLVTDILDGYVYFFDPYYRKKAFYEKDVEIVDMPFKANRKISIKKMELVRNIYFSLGEIESRIALTFNKIKEKK